MPERRASSRQARRAGWRARWIVPGSVPAVWIVVAFSLVLCALYISYTPATVRNPDAHTQLAYVRFILEHGALPTSTTCTVCHHPPLYYGLAAAALRLGQALELADPVRAVQGLSWLLTAVFVGFGASLFRVLLARPWQQALATSLVAFWPYTIMHSARTNPDVAVNAVAAVSLYLAARWWKEGTTRWLVGACACSLLANFCKATGMVLVAVLLCLIAWRVLCSPNRRAAARAVVLPFVLTVAATAAHGLARGDPDDDLARGVLGRAYQTKAAVVERRTASFYLGFDVAAYFQRPEPVADMVRSHEPDFWNHWLKSSLFGTRPLLALPRRTAGPPNDAYAKGLLGLLLALPAFAVGAMIRGRRNGSPSRHFALVAMAPYVAAAIGFHALVPTGHHADFRFVLPLLLPFALLYADAAGRLRAAGGVLWHGSYVLASQWVALSVAYLTPGLQPPERSSALQLGPEGANVSPSGSPAAPSSAESPVRRKPAPMRRPGFREGAAR